MSSARWVNERLDRIAPARLRAAIAAITALVLVGLISHDHYAASGDAVHYLVISRSVAFDADFDVANDYADPNRPMTDPPERHALPGRNGVLRPVHDVGWPVIAAPFVRLAAAAPTPAAFRQLISAFVIVLTAALALLFFSASWRVTEMKTGAVAIAVLWALSPPILTHGYIFLTEVPTALLALAIYQRLDRVRDADDRRTALLLGVLSGLLLLIHVRNIGLVVAFSFLTLWRLTRAPHKRRAFLAGLAAMIAVKLALNWMFWGTLLTTPHEHFAGWPGLQSFVVESATRVFGLLFDARHGLLWSAPIYLLAPAGLVLLARRSRGAAVELLLITAAYLFFVINPVTNVHGWRGGWSPAARFLVPITPFLAMGVPLLFRSRKGALLTSVIGLLQIGISAFQWANPVLTFADGPGPSLWIEKLWSPEFAAAIAMSEPITPMFAAAAVAALIAWMLLTRILTREPEGPAV